MTKIIKKETIGRIRKFIYCTMMKQNHNVIWEEEEQPI
jgi:hypothetical protein